MFYTFHIKQEKWAQHKKNLGIENAFVKGRIYEQRSLGKIFFLIEAGGLVKKSWLGEGIYNEIIVQLLSLNYERDK